MNEERLTARNDKGLAYLVKVKQDEQVVESPFPNTLRAILEGFRHLADYEDITEGISLDRLKEICEAEREGRLLVLPCRVGDTVWDKYGTAWEITQIDICPNGRRWFRCGHKGTDDYTAFDDENIGEYVFLSKQDAKPKDTRAEAEEALKGVEHERD